MTIYLVGTGSVHSHICLIMFVLSTIRPRCCNVRSRVSILASEYGSIRFVLYFRAAQLTGIYDYHLFWNLQNTHLSEIPFLYAMTEGFE